MLDEFIANIRKSGLARPNLFKVDIIFPENIRNPVSRDFFEYYGINTRDAFRVSLFCETAELPGKAIATNPIKTHGPPIKIPYNFILEDVPMVFLCGADMKEKKFFDAWQSMVVNPNTGDLNYYNEYSTSVILTQLNAQHESAYSIKLLSAFPVVVPPVTLGMGETDQILKIPVVFSYRKWEYIPSETAGQVQSIQELALNSGAISSKLKTSLNNLRRTGIKQLTNQFSAVKGISNYFNLF